MNASPGAAVGKVGVRLRHRGQVARPRGEGDSRPPGDQPGRPERHDRRAGHPDQPGRQDQPRRGGRPRDGQDLRVRRRGARRRHQGPAIHSAGRHRGPRGRRDLHRRHDRARSSSARCRWWPRRWCSTSRASSTRTPTRPTTWSRRCTGSCAHADGAAADGGARQRRHRRGRGAGPPVRRAGHRAVPYRAHVPRRAARSSSSG